MERLRTLAQGWLGKVFMFIILAPMALLGIQGYFSGGGEDNILIVNKEKISRKQMDDWIKPQREAYLKAAGGDETLLNDKVIHDKVIQAVIDRTLLLQQADKLGIHFSEEQLSELLKQQAVFQQEGKFSQQLLENYLISNKMSVSQLLVEFNKQISLAMISQSIDRGALHTQQSIDQLIALLSQQRTAHLAKLPLANFAQQTVISTQQAEAYYKQHQTDFIRPTNVDVSYMVLSKADIAKNVTVSDAEIQAAYQDYEKEQQKNIIRQISHILITTDQRTPAQAEQIAKEIETKLKQGQSFEQLVKQYSEDPVSKANKGKIDGYSFGAFGDAFDKTVLALHVGQVSVPVKTQYGYHLIRLDQSNAAPIATLTAMHDQLLDQIKQKKADAQFQDTINHVNDLAVQTDDLNSLAQQYHAPVQHATGVTQHPNQAILNEIAVKTKLFAEEVAQGDQNISTGINLKNGDVLWFKVSAYHAQKTESFKESQANIVAILKRDAQIQQARDSLKPLLVALQHEPAQVALAKNSAIQFTDLGVITRSDPKIDPDIEKNLFSLVQPKAGFWSVTTMPVGDQLNILALSHVSTNPVTLTPAQQQQVVQRFDPRGQHELNDYLNYLRSTAKVDIKDKSTTKE